MFNDALEKKVVVVDGQKFILGPHRVFPGRLSVSRTFGDIEAKKSDLGGNPKVIVADPEIKEFELTDQ